MFFISAHTGEVTYIPANASTESAVPPQMKLHTVNRRNSTEVTAEVAPRALRGMNVS